MTNYTPIRRRIWLCSLLFLSTLFMSAQEHGFANDTLAFRTHLSHNIGTAVDVQMIMQAYYGLSMTKEEARATDKEKAKDVSGKFTFGFQPQAIGTNSYRPLSGVGGNVNTPYWTLPSNNGGIFGLIGPKWNVNNPRFPDAVRKYFRKTSERYRDSVDIKCEKRQLVRDLMAFDSLSANKPMFYATIYSKYKGDYKAYVDDLYKKSIMGNRFRLNVFLRWPSLKKLENDLSVQFAMGLALYKLWMKQVREGKIPYQAASRSESPTDE